VDPKALTVIGKALFAMLTVALPAWATAYAQAKIGTAGAGTLAERPEVAGMIIALQALPEIMVILGFVIAAMIVTTL
jgi:V/A-type H+-transporting ATPase subunit K